MKDWKNIADASGLRIPELEMSRIAAALEGLESAFRPLSQSIPHDVEPAVIFRASPEPEE
jgi:hypothetical protein